MQMVNMGMMQMQMQNQCPTCRGKGSTMEQKCKKCSGRRLINENKVVDIDIEKGMAGGDTILMEREGE